MSSCKLVEHATVTTEVKKFLLQAGGEMGAMESVRILLEGGLEAGGLYGREYEMLMNEVVGLEAIRKRTWEALQRVVEAIKVQS